jgi:hypothetical protein
MPYKDHKKQLAAQREHYQNNKIDYSNSKARLRKKNKQWIADYKVGKNCECGEAHPACLEFHHINPMMKDIKIASAIKHWGLERLKSEVAKCIIICSNCHQKHHWNESYKRLVPPEGIAPSPTR